MSSQCKPSLKICPEGTEMDYLPEMVHRKSG